jgi:hypothetical protein
MNTFVRLIDPIKVKIDNILIEFDNDKYYLIVEELDDDYLILDSFGESIMVDKTNIADISRVGFDTITDLKLTKGVATITEDFTIVNKKGLGVRISKYNQVNVLARFIHDDFYGYTYIIKYQNVVFTVSEICLIHIYVF